MFKFNFSTDDIEEDQIEEIVTSDVLSSEESHVDEQSQPRIYDIKEILEGLPSRLSYSLIPIVSNPSAIAVPRRDVFDIKVQIMADDESLLPNGVEASSEQGQFIKKELSLLLSNTEDLRTEVYEGGLKSWEGANDLTEYLATEVGSIGDGVIELGCGSAIPSIHLFQKYIASLTGPGPHKPVSFILSDYNYSVLRLMAGPNLLLAYHNVKYGQSQVDNQKEHEQQKQEQEQEQEPDLDITPELVTDFLQFLQKKNISIKFISGSWDSHRFRHLVEADFLKFTLILASETIYSPASIGQFSDLLLDALTLWNPVSAGHSATALVAAKDIYFGVGGSVKEFVEYIEHRAGKTEIKRRIVGKSSGVTRTVLEVTKS
ncbi:hypothetical protein V1514DRAFT_301924 [Lipomyces japonicus]|uniref:uncharacterized protein n=1 Tax=Lipomyces japonicus TaxID=56871 RepID=UPI0034CF971F